MNDREKWREGSGISVPTAHDDDRVFVNGPGDLGSILT